jgi:hypothetical protein
MKVCLLIFSLFKKIKNFILDITLSLVEINQKIQDHIKMLNDLKVCLKKQFIIIETYHHF